MLLAPLVALGTQTLAYALATPLCARQAGVWMHAVFALATLVSAWLCAVAWAEAKRLQAAQRSELDSAAVDRRGAQRRFLAEVAAGVAAISALSVLAMWVATWVLSPCQG
jgi:hypothetical protein